MYQPEPYPGLEVVGVESQYGPYADVAGKESIPPTVRSEPPRTPKKTWIIAAAAVAILLIIAGVVGGVVGGLKSKHNDKPIPDA